MQELGLRELKKALISLAVPLMIIIVILLLVMSSFSATTADEVTSVNSILASEIGQKLYKEVWQKPLQDVYEETHISVHIAWVIVPSCMIKDPFVIKYDRAKELVMLALEKKGEEYSEVSLDKFIERLVEQPEFEKLDKEKVKELIEKNEESADTTTIGNIPKSLNEYRRLNLTLPVKEWSGIAEVGMYNPFGEWSMHYGMDIAVPTGTELYAATDVTVEVVYYSEVGGNTLMMRNGSLVIIYCHMRELSFRKVGEKIKAGELVGYSGSTGNVTGPHLHMETWSTDIENVRNGFSIQKEIFFNPRLLWDFRN